MKISPAALAEIARDFHDAIHGKKPPPNEEELNAIGRRVATRCLALLDEIEGAYCVGSQADALPPPCAFCGERQCECETCEQCGDPHGTGAPSLCISCCIFPERGGPGPHEAECGGGC